MGSSGWVLAWNGLQNLKDWSSVPVLNDSCFHALQVVDSADLARLEDCRAELHALLQEERLFGATLLIFANKQDVPSALPVEELEKVGGQGYWAGFKRSWTLGH